MARHALASPLQHCLRVGQVSSIRLVASSSDASRREQAPAPVPATTWPWEVAWKADGLPATFVLLLLLLLGLRAAAGCCRWALLL